MGRITRTKYGLCSTEVFLHAAILQLPVISPVLMVPIVAGKRWLWRSVLLAFDWAADLIVDSDNDPIIMGYSVPGPSGNLANNVSKNGIFTAGKSQLGFFNNTNAAQDPYDLADSEGALELSFTNDGAMAFTGGALGNKLTVKVFFESFDVPIIA